ncbi:MAG: SusC/RagA family TonB-linked outer membrane protein, partial [Rikenellaceae bacterium]
SEGQQLKFSMISYTAQIYTVTTATVHDVVLVEDALTVNEVVVTALGIKRDAKAIGYAVSEIDGDALAESRQTNVTNALSGVVPGLQVVKGSGATGSSKITIRGQSSLSGTNQPLIVIDGIPMDNFTNGDNSYWGSSDMGNGLSDINADDIETMTVLKGGSAAALYGSRAGNGVILITTKSGKQSDGLGITVSSSIGFENPLITPKLQNSFSQGTRGIYNNLSVYSWGAATDGVNTGTNWNGKTETLKTYDNVGNFFNTGVINTQNITLQQQYNKTSVYASIGRMQNNDVVPETKLERTNIVLRATTNLGTSDKWKLDAKMNYVKSSAQNRPTQGINQSNTFYTMYTLPRSINILDFNPSIDSEGNQIWWSSGTSSQNNPYWSAQYGQTYDVRERYIGFMSLSYEFLPWLRGEIKGGMDNYTTTAWSEIHTGGLSNPAGSYSRGVEQFSETNYSFLLIAQKDHLFGKFGGSATFGGNLMSQLRQSQGAGVNELVVPNLFSLGNGVDNAWISESIANRKMNSLYGSAQLNYDSYLFLDVTLRNDWSSTMSKENRSYMYPSVSLSGIISDMVELPSWFTFAKVRASYAIVGNDLDPYQLYNTYSIGSNIFDNTTATPGDIYYSENLVSEKVKSWEAGIDVRFLNNRIRLDASWYKSNATNQLFPLAMDAASGYSYKMVNAGNIQNQGFEISLGADIITGREFNWNATLNVSRNVSKIIELIEGVTEYELGSIENMKVVAEVGGAYGAIYGTKIQTVTDKDSPYYGQWLLTDTGLPQATSDMEYLGEQSPKANISLGQNFSYKGFNLYALFDASIGGKIFSMTNAVLDAYGNSEASAPGGKREDFIVQGVISDGNGGYIKNTNYVTPQQYYSDALGVGNYGIMEAHTYDATSVRLRTISLGYSFPKRLLGDAVQRINVSFTASNPWLIYTGAPGIDPESVSGTGTNVQSFELGISPTYRSYTFNVAIGF